MKKKIGMFIFCLLSCGMFLSAQNSFERERVLTERLVKDFIDDYKDLFTALKKENAGNLLLLSSNDNESVRVIFDKAWKAKPSKKIKRIFTDYGFDRDKGLYQIVVLQYGIVAYTIEETFAEIDNDTRSEKQKESDREASAWLSEIKAQINSADYKLIQKYGKELYDIFNRIEERL